MTTVLTFTLTAPTGALAAAAESVPAFAGALASAFAAAGAVMSLPVFAEALASAFAAATAPSPAFATVTSSVALGCASEAEVDIAIRKRGLEEMVREVLR